MNLIKAKLYDVMTCTFSDIGHVKRNTFIQIIIATIAVIMLVRVFPMGLVQNHTYSRQKAYNTASHDKITGDIFTSNDKKLQTIYFDKNHIYGIKLYMEGTLDDDALQTETILFRLYNSDFSCIYEEEINCSGIVKNSGFTVLPDLEVDTQTAYYYEIIVPQDCKARLILPVADRGALAQKENSTLYIDGIINDEVSLIADFDYTRPLSLVEITFHYVVIILAMLAAYILISIAVFVYDENWQQYENDIIRYTKIGASVLGAAALLGVFIFSVILNKFGGEIWDRLFFTAGIIIAAVWLYLAVWRRDMYRNTPKISKLSVSAKRSLIWRNYIQTVSFGLLFYALCQYVNADRNYYHYTNTRWMLIFLAIAFLMNYNEKQFVNKLSFIWIVLAAVCSVFYCKAFADNKNDLVLARLTCGVAASWGLLIINILLEEIRTRRASLKKIKRYMHNHVQQLICALLWIVFCIFMYVYRFEKVWVFTATLPFAALIFMRSTNAAMSRFVRNFTNGILLSFGFVTLFCLLHRPHHYWMMYRYSGLFHTVACTGMYLAVIFGAAAAKLYGKLKNRKNMLAYCALEYFVTACAAGFILLTMSRTAFLTVTVTLAAIVAITTVTYHKSFKRTMTELGTLMAVCVVSFPMIFSAVRMIPSVVNEPVRYDIEFQDKSFMVYEGDPINSDKYMTVKRFFNTLFGRFQTQEESETAKNTPYVWESGMLAYVGNDFAGIDMHMAVDESDSNNDNEAADISNGRFDIFKSYIKATGIKGHPKMGPENENGEEYPHAHNSYLQIAYNFGIISGVVFIILCALTLWRAVTLFYRLGNKFGIFLVPFALVVVFGFVSLTEWAFHPCIPAGFAFMLMQMLLVKYEPNRL